LTALITNVAAGVGLCVDTSYTDAQLISATLISPAAVSGVSCGAGQTAVLAPGTTTGSVQVIWGITSSNPSAFPASLLFNVYTTYTGAPGPNGGSPATGVEALATGGFWPQKSGWANGDPIPEFLLASPPPPGVGLFQVTLCQTILLFPYITDFYGFDTGIAISNTSLDTGALPAGLGASQQTGACQVYFYGNDAVATTLGTTGVYSSTSDTSLTNGMITPGQTWAFSLSGIDAGYNSTATYGTTGYAIAVCNFQYAHGYSFVSDTGIRNFAAAYLALIIPDAPRAPRPFVCAGAASCTGEPGEQLVH
jgi:hypothetical protein